jgi:Flp pilus assembly protein CpaB
MPAVSSIIAAAAVVAAGASAYTQKQAADKSQKAAKNAQQREENEKNRQSNIAKARADKSMGSKITGFGLGATQFQGGDNAGTASIGQKTLLGQ